MEPQGDKRRRTYHARPIARFPSKPGTQGQATPSAATQTPGRSRFGGGFGNKGRRRPFTQGGAARPAHTATTPGTAHTVSAHTSQTTTTPHHTQHARPQHGHGDKRPGARPKGRRFGAPGGRREKAQGIHVHRASPATLPEHRIPDPSADAVRIVPLGGVEEVGKNMCVIETKDDLLIVDAGFQFMSESDAPGVDYVLPNTKYLEERKEKIRGLLVTHAHLDHIGGIPFIMERIGNPPIYTRELTSIMIKKRQEEFPHLPALDIKVLDDNERITLGSLKITTFPVTHSIPDSSGFIIETAYGNVVISGDFKLDHVGGVATEEEDKKYTAIGKLNNLLLIADSTNAEKPGFSIPEKEIHANLERLITEAKGRLIIGTFASQFERMVRIIQACERSNKKVVTEGRSIRTNIEIAQKAGLITPRKDTLITAQEAESLPPDRVVVLATGAQGEEFAALMRIATKKHPHLRLNKRDTIILSSSVIPGNEINVQKLKDNLYRHGLKVIHYRVSDVHSTGHGNAGELAWINKKIGAKFFMPAYGYHSMIRSHAQAVMDLNGKLESEIILPDNGSVIDIEKGETLNIHKAKAPAGIMMVDGFSVGDMQEVVIRDRQTLSKDGIVTIFGIINPKTGKLRKSPDIISRGFVYIRESQELFQEARNLIKKSVEDAAHGMNPINLDYVKENVADDVGRLLFQKTNKKPIVIAVLIAL
jgi:ribonuclease J